ncbi:sulfurase [Bacillus sp. FJAT-27225]|uniref:MOSC domain-containing protein n=1 Tax=Bacillus sp. FJAT-27225 TaxID=1743144 RepID=UPI00080C242D|nr:MOSC domain-containing protein [Bacillus sp. FJAT-27225]OCA90801.1 sulfurase [Bacillus sp. FJAT-27225]
MNEMNIVQFSLGKPKKFLHNGKAYRSAIGKEPVLEAYLYKEGLAGDGVAHPAFHGGPDRALCLYPYEHYAKWEAEFGKKLEPPIFGENITATGMLEKDVHIGDIFKIGNATVQVTQGRIPCSSISRYNDIDVFLKRAMETCLTGYFFRVLEEGSINREANIELIQKHPKGISVLSAAEIILHKKRHNQALILEVIDIPELAEEWRRSLKKLVKM